MVDRRCQPFRSNSRCGGQREHRLTIVGSSGAFAHPTTIRGGAGAFPQLLLHQHAVEPAVELEADRGEGADVAETRRLVQPDRGRLCRIADHRDHLPVAALLGFNEQPVEQRASDAAAMRLRCDVDRILDGEAVGRPRAIGPGIGVAQDCAVGAFAFRHHEGEAARAQRLEAPRHLGCVRRIELERGGAVQDGVGVDARDRRDVTQLGRADGDQGHRLTRRHACESGHPVNSVIAVNISSAGAASSTRQGPSSPMFNTLILLPLSGAHPTWRDLLPVSSRSKMTQRRHWPA